MGGHGIGEIFDSFSIFSQAMSNIYHCMIEFSNGESPYCKSPYFLSLLTHTHNIYLHITLFFNFYPAVKHVLKSVFSEIRVKT